MKKTYYLLMMIAIAGMMTSCNKLDYKKTKSGLLYKIISSNSKDSVAKAGDWLKIYFTQKRDDSVFQNNYGKMPIYQQVVQDPSMDYNPAEIFPLLKKGDSAVIVMFVDSFVRKRANFQMPPYLKKGDKLTLTFKVVDVIRDEAHYQQDAEAEYEKDLPRQKQEQAKQIAEAQAKEMKDAIASGKAATQIKEIEHYLAAHNITAQKTPNGTFVRIDQQGTGAQADSGKFLNVKYAGRVLRTDSSFEKGTYPFQLLVDPLIGGWVDGLKLFKEGGKGTLYIPAYRAYGDNANPNSPIKAGDALIFDVEMLNVSDKPLPPPPPSMPVATDSVVPTKPAKRK